MINCPNCGGLNQEGSQVCGACGTSLINNTMANNNVNTVQEQNQIDDNDLINAYIGNNADTLRNGTFSWCTLFFEGIYIWYRKMYGLLGIWFLIMIGLGFGEALIKYIILGNSANLVTAASSVKILNTVFKIIDLIVVVIIALNFKSLYLKRVKEKVLMIKNENPNSSAEELMQICRKKGGTTAAPIIIFIAIFVIAFVIIYLTTFRKAASTTTEYLDTARTNAFSDQALMAVEATRNDVITNGLNSNYKVYNMNDIIELVYQPLQTSPYGKDYVDIKVKVTKEGSSFRYQICMIDSGHNGFGYTDEHNVNSSAVKVGTAPTSCE